MKQQTHKASQSQNSIADLAAAPLPYSNVEDFLKFIERRAFHMARINTGDTETALDIVQDAMYKLVEKYSHKTAKEWKPLFYRILSSKLTDYYRRKAIRDKVFIWSKSQTADEDSSFMIQPQALRGELLKPLTRCLCAASASTGSTSLCSNYPIASARLLCCAAGRD